MLRLPCSSRTQAMRGTSFAVVMSLGKGALRTCSSVKGCWAPAHEAAIRRYKSPQVKAAAHLLRIGLFIALLNPPAVELSLFPGRLAVPPEDRKWSETE